MSPTPITQFESNLTYVRDLLSLGRAVDASTTGALDVGDIHRAAIVMVVSAMDHYVHEKARTGMYEVLSGKRSATPAFERFPVAMVVALRARSDPASEEWLDEAVRAQHGHRPFLKTEDIADAIRLISPIELWKCVADELGSSAAAVKAQVKTIVDRRNKIAHEADIDPTQPSRRWPISAALATAAVEYVEEVVRAIEARA